MGRTAAGVATARVTWLGHATVLLELGAVRLLTDPVLRGRLAHLRRHAPLPPAPGDLDAVLVSHAHHDHFDLPSLRLLGPLRAAVVPLGTARLLRRVPVDSVLEVGEGDERRFGDVVVRAVRAVHDGGRAPSGRFRTALGFVIEHRGLRVYFAGDTERFDGMGGSDAVDLALLPVWGWGPTLGPGHMDPEEAAAAVAALHPRIAVPIHWGTFLPVGLRRRRGDLLTTPGRRFAQRVARLVPDGGVRVRVLAPGEAFDLRTAS